jgi:hypothetical protein
MAIRPWYRSGASASELRDTAGRLRLQLEPRKTGGRSTEAPSFTTNGKP